MDQSADAKPNTLLIFSDEAPGYLAAVQRHPLPNLSVVAATKLEGARAWCQVCNIVLGEPHRVRLILPELEHLEWVQSTYVGVQPLLDPACRRDYLLTTLGGLYAPVLTEYVFCYLLMHERRALQRFRSQFEGRWDNTVTGTLRGKVLGLMGVGRSGSRIAEMAKHFGLRTRGYTRSSESCESIDVYYHGDQVLEFVADLDYLVCVLPDTAETQHLVDRAVLEALPRQALLINLGRGSAVDEDALLEALQAGTLTGAVLDVFEEEPLPAGHPLWTAPNLLITFHTAAPGPGYYEEIAAIFAENYHLFVQGSPLKDRVDFARGY
jgi:phosphoglycerate dehydrogenase-like enzyme